MEYLEPRANDASLEDLERVIEGLGGLRCAHGDLVAACHETDNFEVLLLRRKAEPSDVFRAMSERMAELQDELKEHSQCDVFGSPQEPSEEEIAYWEDQLHARREQHERHKVPIGRTKNGHVVYASGRSNFVREILEEVLLPPAPDVDDDRPPRHGESS